MSDKFDRCMLPALVSWTQELGSEVHSNRRHAYSSYEQRRTGLGDIEVVNFAD